MVEKSLKLREKEKLVEKRKRAEELPRVTFVDQVEFNNPSHQIEKKNVCQQILATRDRCCSGRPNQVQLPENTFLPQLYHRVRDSIYLTCTLKSGGPRLSHAARARIPETENRSKVVHFVFIK